MRAVILFAFAAACHDPDCEERSFFADGDGDGHGAVEDSIERCSAPAGYVSTNDDCDDGDAAIHPGAVETCNDRDDDCDGTIDAGASDAPTWYADDDSDGYGDSGGGVRACIQPSGTVADGTDCDDGSADVRPGATEVCNTIDDDCDGLADNVVGAVTFYEDADGDGFGQSDSTVLGCEAPKGYALEPGDCDDATSTTFPGAIEKCGNLVDDDCDPATDECLWFIDDADVFFEGSEVDTYLGFAFTTGDLDADGAADLIAGALNAYGQVYVTFGPLSSDRSTDDADVAVRNDTGRQIWPGLVCGDADGDANDDLLVSTVDDYGYVLYGPVTADVSLSDFDLRLKPHQLTDLIGIAIVEDHDGDGLTDVAVTDRWTYGSTLDHVYVMTGAASGTVTLASDSTYIYGNVGNNWLGWSMASVDDTTGDGIADLALGDPFYGGSSDEQNAVYILPGGEEPGSYSVEAAVGTLATTTGDDGFGHAMAAADRDGDGYTDVLVGAWGRVYEFRGPLTDLRDVGDADASWEGEAMEFGLSIAADGDVDGDGQTDALFGAPAPYDPSAVYVQLGPASGSLDAADLPKVDAGGSFIGSEVAFVPDWTGDGAPEIAISDEWESNTGRVGVFFSEAF